MSLTVRLARRICTFLDENKFFKPFFFGGREFCKVLYDWAKLLAVIMRENYKKNFAKLTDSEVKKTEATQFPVL